jgi:hypothetical protein
MRQRYHVEILDTGVFVIDSYDKGRVMRQWPSVYYLKLCPTCGNEISRRQEKDHDSVRQAIELCQKLNKDFADQLARDTRAALACQREFQDHQNQISQAAVTMGAKNVNLIT